VPNQQTQTARRQPLSSLTPRRRPSSLTRPAPQHDTIAPWPSSRSRAPTARTTAESNPEIQRRRHDQACPGMGRRGEPYYVEAAPPVDVNKNTEWFMYPGVWTTYILLLFFAWLLVLSVSGCSPGAAWTVVNLAHFAVSSHPLFRPQFLALSTGVCLRAVAHAIDF
jgi:hypothetical protein